MIFVSRVVCWLGRFVSFEFFFCGIGLGGDGGLVEVGFFFLGSFRFDWGDLGFVFWERGLWLCIYIRSCLVCRSYV